MPRKKPNIRPDYNWHHRRAKTNRGSGKISSGNMVEVRADHHRAFHLLFETKSTPDIARVLNETWLDPEWMLVAIKREE